MGVKTLMTRTEFERLPDDGQRYELDHGELVSMPRPPTNWRRPTFFQVLRRP